MSDDHGLEHASGHGHAYDEHHDRADLKEVRDAANSAYSALKSFFQDSTNYWQLGCCFDTMTDALRILGPATDPTLAWDALLKYNATSGAWYDDFAWWAIASAKAYDPAFAPVFGRFAHSFTGIAQGCWNVLDEGLNDGVHNGAPQVYVNRDNESFFVTPPEIPLYWAAPRFDDGRGSGLHGVWQKDMFANARTAPNWVGPGEFGPNPSAPGDATKLGPYQNTVVNALYFLAAVRFEQARVTNRAIPSRASQLADEFGFLRTWMGLDPARPLPAGETLLNMEFNDASAVVRERVSTYAFNGAVYPKVENWDGRTSWAGDQGLMINALAGWLQLNPGNSPISALIQSLMLGYSRHVVDANGVPQPYFPITGNKLADWDFGDYESGVGVFMRGLLQAARTPGSPVRSYSRAGEFQSFLKRAVAWASTATPVDLFQALNILATLLVGLELLLPTE